MVTSHAALSFGANTWKSILTLEQLLELAQGEERRGGRTNRHQDLL